MVRLAPERVLLIGDTGREVQDALSQAVPAAQVTSVTSIFDGIAELSGGNYTTVMAAAEPIERRPEAAVRTLRDLAGDGRVILFGHATLELLSRKMLQFGCDDYIITPASTDEIQQLFGGSPLRLGEDNAATPAPATDAPAQLATLPLAEILLDAMLQQPHDAAAAAIRQINAFLGASGELAYHAGDEPAPAVEDDAVLLLSHAVRVNNDPAGTLYLALRGKAEDEAAGRHALAQIAHVIGKLATLQDRHNRLQKLAITDEMTGAYNARYFRHFLTRILERARQVHFPVTLLLFDIDDFKKYNDQFGHGVGDEILKQTATLMRRCTREHDLVARIGGDEFAVVFWDKEGPRQSRDPNTPPTASRPPQTPIQVFERFKRMLTGEEFTALGAHGKGVLGISAGLAVFPYEATDVDGLIKEADKRLMHGAKKCGKNTIYIVGTEDAGVDQR